MNYRIDVERDPLTTAIPSIEETATPVAPADTSRCVLVCQYRSCQKNGSAAVLEAFQAARLPGVTVRGCGCQGQCSTGATVRVLPDETWYCRVKPSDVPAIAQQHLQNGRPVARLLHPRFHPYAQYYG